MSIEFAGTVQVPSLLRSIKMGWDLLIQSERKRMMWLWVLIVADGLFRTLALVAIVPFVLIAVDPDRFLDHPRFKDAVDFIGADSPTDLLVATGIFLLGVVFIKNAISWFTLRATNHFCASCETRLSEYMLGRVLRAPIAWTTQHNSQRLRVVIKDHVRAWAGSFQRSLLTLVNDLVFTATMMVVLIYASPVGGAAVSFSAIMLSLLMFRVIRPIILRLAEISRAAKIEATVLGTQAIAGVKDVKMTGTEAFFLHEFVNKVQISAFTDSRVKLWQQIPKMTIEMVAYGALIGLIVVALASGVTPGELAAVAALYAVAALRLMPILSSVVTTFGIVLNVFPMIQEIHRLISETREGEALSSAEEDRFADPSARRFPDWTTISFQSVSYNYASGRSPAVKDLDLQLEFGKIYGIAGSSGAGKSTIVDILSGLLKPSRGSMLIDDNHLNSLGDLRDWRKEVGYVSQTPFMLDATLRENIAFGLTSADIDDARLSQAVKMANLQGVVDELPDGLETMIGESAIRLSGGQRQRVAIARALFQDVRLLILDEATSALDNVSEREIKKTLAQLAGRLTIVIVAHRLSTLRGCDTIFVIDRGGLVDQGQFDGLVANCQIFRHMVRAADALDDDEIGAAKSAVETASLSTISSP